MSRARILSGLAILCLLLAPIPAQAQAAPTCLGRTAAEWQAAGYIVVMGTAGNNWLNASWKKSVVFGLGGDDRLNGGTADDVLCGGDGNDILTPGGGINVLVGGRGHDELRAGPKRDDMIGGEVINGAPGDPPNHPVRPAGWFEGVAPHGPDPYEGRIYALGWWFDCDPDDGDDTLTEGAGGAGEEPNVGPVLWGCAGDDWLDGGDGDEYLLAGPGDDHLIGGPGNDWAGCGDGYDIADMGLNQGAVHPDGVWAAIDADDGHCEVALNIP